MGSCHKPTSTPAVRMPVQEQLTQGLAVQVHKQVCALTQGAFLTLLYSCLEGGNQHESGWYHEASTTVWIAKQLFSSSTMCLWQWFVWLMPLWLCGMNHYMCRSTTPVDLIMGQKKKKLSSFPDCFRAPGTIQTHKLLLIPSQENVYTSGFTINNSFSIVTKQRTCQRRLIYSI